MVVLERSNARCVCTFYRNGLVGFKRSQNGCIVGAIEKAYATWLTKPNKARTSVMFLGVGKPVMASRYFCDGWCISPCGDTKCPGDLPRRTSRSNPVLTSSCQWMGTVMGVWHGLGTAFGSMLNESGGPAIMGRG